VGGDLQGTFDKVYIVDCRYDYEYAGGHIKGAININDREALDALFFQQPTGGTRTAIIMHCEFSVNRGPTMCRHLREKDRHIHGIHSKNPY
jgi:rhodanese-related sulfurtransferase